ncbi:MAG: Ig-like domain-containing protein, partial [Myxococcota bacterium]
MDSVFPADDSIDVDLNPALVMNLNVPASVDYELTTNIALYRAADGALVDDFKVHHGNLIDPYTVELWPSRSLEPFTSYYVTIERDALLIDSPSGDRIGDFADAPDGNSFHPDMWNFTTGADAGTSAPLPRVVDSVFPADNATDVAADTQLILGLNMKAAITQWTRSIAVHRADDDSLVEHIRLLPEHLVDDYTIAVDLSNPLEVDTEYYVLIERGAWRIEQPPWNSVGDHTGYPAGVSGNPTMWNFYVPPPCQLSDLRIAELNIGVADYVTLYNPTSCDFDIDNIHLYVLDSLTSFLPKDFDLPARNIGPGERIRLIEREASGNDILLSQNIPFYPGRGGWTGICEGTCDIVTGSNFIDLLAFRGGEEPPTLPSELSFSPDPATGITVFNESSHSFLRAAYAGLFPVFLT